MGINNNSPIYLDNSATTSLCSEAIDKMNYVMTNVYGNPSSLHKSGLDAEKIVSEARNEILNALGVMTPIPKNLIFCSSGTEANNLAIFGTVYAKKSNKGKCIISTDSEHSSIVEPLKKLEEDGFNVIKLGTKNGIIDLDMLRNSISSDTIMLSIMLVNNETGAVNDIKSISAIAKTVNPNVVIHCDAVQGFLKLKFTPENIGADLVTISSHKIHGPKGVGALYVNSSILTAKKLIPIILGGGQENAMRSGTENVIGISGFGAAAKYGYKNIDLNISKMSNLRTYIIDKMPEKVKMNIPNSEKLAPHILNITLPAIKSEIMLHQLSKNGIYISSGSACSSHSKHTNYVLKAFGLSERESDCSIRISLNPNISIDELNCFVDALQNGINQLIPMSFS